MILKTLSAEAIAFSETSTTTGSLYFANGLNSAPVCQIGEASFIKPVGNSTTASRDLMNEEDVKMIISVLAESVAARLRRHQLGRLACASPGLELSRSDVF